MLVQAFPKDKLEPYNPIKTEAAELKTDIKTKSGKAGTTDSSKEIPKGIQEEESEEDWENKENQQREEQKQEEQKQEEQKQEEQKQEEQKQEEQEIEEQTLENTDREEEKEESKEEEILPKEDSQTKENQQNNEEAGEKGENAEESLPQKGDHKGNGKNEGAGETGDKDKNNPEKEINGDISTEGGEEIVEGSGVGEAPGEDEHGLVTDLFDKIILFSELKEDTLHFFAYYSDAEVKSDIRVNYRHKNDNTNGIWLQKTGEHNYSTKLSLGQNYITIYYTDEKGERNWTRITITYQADKADAANPQKGKHPPIIKTNLDDWTDDIRVFEFTFTVDAKKYDGTRIYNNNIQVWLDGESVTNPTGSGIYEYVLRFGMPIEGDTTNHVVSVLAWDDEGNSRLVNYTIRHKVNDEGTIIGSVRVQIDATTLGLGIIDEGEVAIASGDTAAVAVIKMLEEYGYSYTNTGDLQNDFYLSGISRADAFRGAAIEERLQRLIERDGITFLPNSGRDRLGEFDYTRGSGWMYFLNGEQCPGKAMSGYTLNGGELISLRFTLAFGKDVGSFFGDGSTSLTGYCGKWVNGTIIEYDHHYHEKERVEPSKEAEGYILYLCETCQEEKTEVLSYTPLEEEKPLPEGGSEEPPEGGSEEPPEGGSEVPSEGGSEELPEGGSEIPPEGGSEEPPEGGSEILPEGGSEEPPEGGSEIPPEGGSEEPPEGGSEEPPEGGSEEPPEGGSEEPPEGGSEIPPEEGSEEPPEGENKEL